MSNIDIKRQVAVHSRASRLDLLFIFLMLLSNTVFSAYIVSILSVLYLFVYLITEKFVVPRDLARFIMIPTVLFLIGISGSPGNLLYDVLKDGWYFINPFLVLCAGYLVMRKVRAIEPILKIFVIGGFLLAMAHLSRILSDPLIMFDAAVKDIHAELGAGYFLTLLSLSIILFARRLNIVIFRIDHKNILFYIIMLADAASIILSFSRTLLISFVITYLVMAGFIALRRSRTILIAGTMLMVFMLLVNLVPNEWKDQNGMMGKMLNSVDEVLMRDYITKADIGAHWRGYESYMAMKTYLSGSLINIIAGHGFGTLVDVKINIQLGNEEFRFIPVMHNGYMYLLVKTGAIGLLLFLIYLYGLFKSGVEYAERSDGHFIFAGRLIIATTLTLFFTTFVISGIFNKSGLVAVIFLLGSLLSYVKTSRDEDIEA